MLESFETYEPSSEELAIMEEILDEMSLFVRKPAICICENKDADQLGSNCAADQRLCFR